MGADNVNTVWADDSLPSGVADCDRIHGDTQQSLYQSAGGLRALMENAGSNTVLPSSSAASSPWWMGQFMEGRSTGLVEAMNSASAYDDLLAKVLDVQEGPWQSALIEPRHFVVAPLRQFGISLGASVVTAIRAVGEQAPLAARQVPSAFEAVRTGLLGITRVSVVTRPISGIDDEDAEWDDSDDGPTWLSMGALPYRGGGVMARQRFRE